MDLEEKLERVLSSLKYCFNYASIVLLPGASWHLYAHYMNCVALQIIPLVSKLLLMYNFSERMKRNYVVMKREKKKKKKTKKQKNKGGFRAPRVGCEHNKHR